MICMQVRKYSDRVQGSGKVVSVLLSAHFQEIKSKITDSVNLLRFVQLPTPHKLESCDYII